MSVGKGESPDYLRAFNTLESATFIVAFQPFTQSAFQVSVGLSIVFILIVYYRPGPTVSSASLVSTHEKSKGAIVSGASAKKLIIYF